MAVACFALACTGIAGVAHAQEADDAERDAEARRAFRVAQAHYDNGDFERAAAGFEEAYRLSGRAQLLYNTYIAYRDAQNIPRAVDALRRYLEAVPDTPDADQLRARLARMQAALERSGATTTVEPDEADPRGIDAEAMGAEPDLATDDHAEETTAGGGAGSGGQGTAAGVGDGGDRAAQDTGGGPPIAAIVVGGAGLALVAGGVVTGILTASAQSELEEGCPSRAGCDPALEDTQARGQTLALVTDILLFGGLAAVGTGVALWLLTGNADTETDPGDTVASVGCGPAGCGGSLKVSF